LPPRLCRNVRRLPESRLGLGAVEKVAFEVDDTRRGDEVGVHFTTAELRADAEERIHGALAVWCHQH